MDEPADHQALFRYLDTIGVAWSNHEHPPVYTVEESKRLRGDLDGAHVKNLFLRDRKRRYFLLTVREEIPIDLKSLRTRLGAKGGLSFASPERLWEVLRLRPGSVTPFGVLNDQEQRVPVALDRGLAEAEPINAHPLRNDMTTSVSWEGLLHFLGETGHSPELLNFRDGDG